MEGFFGKLFFGSDDAKKEVGAGQAGGSEETGERPGFFESLTESGPYMEELKRQRRAVVDEYMKEKRRLTEGLRREETERDKELRREIEEIERHYGLARLAAGDPRREEAQRKADEKIEKLKRHWERDWHRMKQARLQDLKKQREERWQAVKKEIKGRFG